MLLRSACCTLASPMNPSASEVVKLTVKRTTGSPTTATLVSVNVSVVVDVNGVLELLELDGDEEVDRDDEDVV
eukprot:5380978-Amphidinium_carterae.1